ncbi:MAG: hypothetical protein EAY81_07470 [Bacteroidetes bacterium]|nr:MAG: hypothetical protein EAY81_07470 [Bacteroidota bacterium]
MDTKITLSFNSEVIANAKEFANSHNISLSRLTEFIYSQLTLKNYPSLDDLPISEWVSMVSEGEAIYKPIKEARKKTKDEYYASRKKK